MTSNPTPTTSKDDIERLAEAEDAAGVVDQQTAASAAAGGWRPEAPAAPKRLAEAADEVKAQAKVVAEQAKTQARAVADQAASRAREVASQARSLAGRGAEQGREAIVERPWAAVGLALLAGLVLGHAMGASRPTLVYLKDRRPL